MELLPGPLSASLLIAQFPIMIPVLQRFTLSLVQSGPALQDYGPRMFRMNKI